jgi:hypothetical protein
MLVSFSVLLSTFFIFLRQAFAQLCSDQGHSFSEAEMADLMADIGDQVI